jgi:hypothetical protein
VATRGLLDRARIDRNRCSRARCARRNGIIALVCGLVLAFYAYDVARQIELVREQRKGTRGIGPGVEHWTLLATSVAFCVIALVLLEHDWRTAVVTLTFFGACALVFWTNILRKRREKHWQGATVQVRGGVNISAQGARMESSPRKQPRGHERRPVHCTTQLRH